MPADLSFQAVLAILGSIASIEADTDARDPTAPTFSIKLTLSRKWQDEYGAKDFAYSPSPKLLLEALKRELQRLLDSDYREVMWASEEENFHAPIEELIEYATNEYQKRRGLNDLASRIESSIFQEIEGRLKQLKRRRKAGGAPKTTRERQWNADSRSWQAQEGPEAEILREQQRKAREQASGQKDYTSPWETSWEETYRSAFEDSFRYNDFFSKKGRRYKGDYSSGGTFSQNTPEPKWYEILGCQPGASRDEIRRAARTAAKGLHPDIPGQDTPENRAKIRTINEAKAEGLAGAAK